MPENVNISNQPLRVSIESIDSNTLNDIFEQFNSPIGASRTESRTRSKEFTKQEKIIDRLNAVQDSISKFDKLLEKAKDFGAQGGILGKFNTVDFLKSLNKQIENSIQLATKSGMNPAEVKRRRDFEYEIATILAQDEIEILNQEKALSRVLRINELYMDRMVENHKRQKMLSSEIEFQRAKIEIISDKYGSIKNLTFSILENLKQSSIVSDDFAGNIQKAMLDAHNIIYSIPDMLKIAGGMHLWERAADFQRDIQHTAVAMQGISASSSEVTDQFREQAKHIVRVGKGIIDIDKSSDSINTLWNIGISNLNRQREILESSVQTSVELGLEFSNVVTHSGELAFNLRLTGNQVSTIIRSLSRMTREFGLSAQKVFDIQRGSQNILENMRKMGNVTSKNVEAITRLQAATEKTRGSTEFTVQLFESFAKGGVKGYTDAFENLGVTFGLITQRLKEMGVTNQEIISGQVDQYKLSRAAYEQLLDYYGQIEGLQPIAQVERLRTLTNGLISSETELKRTILAASKAIESSGDAALNKLNELKEQLKNTIDEGLRRDLKSQIDYLTDSLVSDVTGSLEDLSSTIGESIDLSKALGFSEDKMSQEILNAFNKSKDKIEQSINVALQAGVKLEGIDKDTFSNLEERIQEVVSKNENANIVLSDINKILERTRKENEELTEKQMDLSVKNTIDQLESGKNLGQLDLLGVQVKALDNITGYLKTIARVATVYAVLAPLIRGSLKAGSFVGSLLPGRSSKGNFSDRGLGGMVAGAAGGAGGAELGKGIPSSETLDQTGDFINRVGVFLNNLVKSGIRKVMKPGLIKSIGMVLLKGAAAFGILAVGIGALATGVMLLGKAVLGILGGAEKAKEISSGITTVMSSFAKIAAAILASSALLTGLGWVVASGPALPVIAGMMAAGAATLLVLTPLMVGLAGGIIKLSSGIMALTGLDSKKAEEAATGISTIMTSFAKIAGAVLASSAFLTILGTALPVMVAAVPLMLLGTEALAIFTPVMLGLASVYIGLSSKFLDIIGPDPEQAKATADIVASIFVSLAKIAGAVVISVGALNLLGAGFPLILTSIPTMILGTMVLMALTPVMLGAAKAVTGFASILLKVMDINPKEMKETAETMGSIFKSMGDIASGVLNSFKSLVKMGVAAPLIFLGIPLLMQGASALNAMTTAVMVAAASLFNLSKTIMTVLKMDPKEAAKISEDLGSLLENFSKILVSVSEGSENLKSMRPGWFRTIEGLKEKIEKGSEAASEITMAVLAGAKVLFDKVLASDIIKEGKTDEVNSTVTKVKNSIWAMSEFSKAIIEGKDNLLGLKKMTKKSDEISEAVTNGAAGMADIAQSTLGAAKVISDKVVKVLDEMDSDLIISTVTKVKNIFWSMNQISSLMVDFSKNSKKLTKMKGIEIVGSSLSEAISNIATSLDTKEFNDSIERISNVDSSLNTVLDVLNNIQETSGKISNLKTKSPTVGGSQMTVNNTGLYTDGDKSNSQIKALNGIHGNTAAMVSLLTKLVDISSKKQPSANTSKVKGGSYLGKTRPDPKNTILSPIGNDFGADASWPYDIAFLTGVTEPRTP